MRKRKRQELLADMVLTASRQSRRIHWLEEVIGSVADSFDEGGFKSASATLRASLHLFEVEK